MIQKPVVYSGEAFSLSLRLIEGWEYEYVINPTDSGIRCRPKGITEGWLYFGYWLERNQPQDESRYYAEGSDGEHAILTSYPFTVKSKLGVDTRHVIWSHRRYDLEKGDYVVINEAADQWFLEYEDQIEDTITLANYSIA